MCPPRLSVPLSLSPRLFLPNSLVQKNGELTLFPNVFSTSRRHNTAQGRTQLTFFFFTFFVHSDDVNDKSDANPGIDWMHVKIRLIFSNS